MNAQFHNDNSQVNSTATEFLQLLITSVDNNVVLEQIIYSVMEPLLVVVKHSIENKDFVMQVQLLSLLKHIILHHTTVYAQNLQV